MTSRTQSAKTPPSTSLASLDWRDIKSGREHLLPAPAAIEQAAPRSTDPVPFMRIRTADYTPTALAA